MKFRKVDCARLYALSDPRDGRPRYIGIAYIDITKRYKAHMATARNGLILHRVYDWIRELVALGLAPTVREIDSVPGRGERPHSWVFQEWERKAIEAWRFHYPDLLNSHAGNHPENRKPKR